MEVQVLHSKSGKSLCSLSGLSPTSTISDVKRKYKQIKNTPPSRQSFKADPKSKLLKDTETLESIGLTKGGKLYFRDLGPQVSYTGVFLCEYAGPLCIYLLFYGRPAIVYGASAASATRHPVVTIACACWTLHYAKRLLETVFVHRFSHATMPVMNLFRNSGYYWGFAAFVSYFINHPLYTPPMFGNLQVYSSLGIFAMCELGNLSIHVALKNLRPAGSTVRKIPRATGNPFTSLFEMVSCPNYTYEVGSWAAFTVMTQCLPAGLFTLAGFYQMTVWALGKHKNYLKDFKDYPRRRKAILPFML